MLTLTLFRHAKSSWNQPELEDFDRPLSPRGQKAAPRMAAFLAEHNLAPNHVLCSTARRTRYTLDLALASWKTRPVIEYSDALYLAAPETLLAALRAVPAKAKNVMIVGHNPGLESLALEMIGSGDLDARKALAAKFPTAAIAVITFEARSWRTIQPGSGHLSLFATPKMLNS